MSKTSGVIAAAAVFFVSITCTSAGCLLESAAAPVGLHSSCCQHAPEAPSPADHKEHCPLCERSHLVARIVEKIAIHAGSVDLLPTCHLPAAAPVRLAPSVSICGREMAGLLAIASPGTLVELHCSLLI